MSTAISKWGNAAGLRIPQPFLKQIGLGIGDSVELKVTADNCLVIKKTGPSLADMLSRCTPENSHMEYFCEPIGKEII
ncbi:AbrB/MazE/SpoVT family DNA-binding domain-containing protein [Rosenbergiella sp. S61]|uniref:AbrB/MazE/SpoVT family DNA-binding domain-containing protein n=1 Tax=Rosenbergiella gaditana TaxID=2726987 RepID=A0ABS5T2R3_9GAMM|nr:AbrB/MazE/SpoVT family DNA-binding domain-containing protein [Rosenbergiella gaditana]MBT0725732.1 AbrB/MazE/SpoVT family DNA-binding domain-containing protein [Rosenbergiella gaditana]